MPRSPRAVAPVSLPVCLPAQLTAEFTTVSAASAGEQAGFVELRDTGPRSCRLSGRPVLTLLSATGSALPTTEAAAPLYAAAGVALTPGTGSIVPLHPVVGHAFLAVLFNPVISAAGRLCGPGTAERPAALGLRLPGDAAVLRVSALAADGSGHRVLACGGDVAVSVLASEATAQS